MEPLESTSLHLVQTAVARFMKYIPSSPTENQGRENFNRQIGAEWEQIRDFLILHYTANGRTGEPFWDECRSMPLPDSLTAKIRLFEQSGVVVKEEGELFTEEGWTQVMVGQGIEPRSRTPLTAALDGEELGQFLASLAKAYEQRALSLPMHEQWIEHVMSGRVRAAAASPQ
jgi:tryptophan halogenase